MHLDDDVIMMKFITRGVINVPLFRLSRSSLGWPLWCNRGRKSRVRSSRALSHYSASTPVGTVLGPRAPHSYFGAVDLRLVGLCGTETETETDTDTDTFSASAKLNLVRELPHGQGLHTWMVNLTRDVKAAGIVGKLFPQSVNVAPCPVTSSSVGALWSPHAGASGRSTRKVHIFSNFVPGGPERLVHRSTLHQYI